MLLVHQHLGHLEWGRNFSLSSHVAFSIKNNHVQRRFPLLLCPDWKETLQHPSQKGLSCRGIHFTIKLSGFLQILLTFNWYINP